MDGEPAELLISFNDFLNGFEVSTDRP